MRTAVGKRVKTLYFTGAIVAIAQTPSGGVMVESKLIQDDITIIGVQLSFSAEVSDTAINTDGFQGGHTEITRAGVYGQEGIIAYAGEAMRWQGIFVYGKGMAKENVMFPEGYGIDIDNGEYLNLIGTNQNYSDDTCSTYHTAIVYYVER